MGYPKRSLPEPVSINIRGDTVESLLGFFQQTIRELACFISSLFFFSFLWRSSSDF